MLSTFSLHVLFEEVFSAQNPPEYPSLPLRCQPSIQSAPSRYLLQTQRLDRQDHLSWDSGRLVTPRKPHHFAAECADSRAHGNASKLERCHHVVMASRPRGESDRSQMCTRPIHRRGGWRGSSATYTSNRYASGVPNQSVVRRQRPRRTTVRRRMRKACGPERRSSCSRWTNGFAY